MVRVHTYMYMYVYAYVCATMMLAYMYVTCTLPQVYENAGYATQGALVTTLPIITADRVCGMLGRHGSVPIVFPVTSYDCDSCW